VRAEVVVSHIKFAGSVSVMPAQAGIQNYFARASSDASWIPAFAGMFMHLRHTLEHEKRGTSFLDPPHPSPLSSGRGNFRRNDATASTPQEEITNLIQPAARKENEA
jgi:hypothetical protein